jgi:Kef-type K+ transport system membrane component KefB
MQADIVPLIVGVLILISSLISLATGLSVAIIEILSGIFASAFGLKPEVWMMYIASMGGIILTFLAGTETDIALLKEKAKESFLIGFFSFLIPFLGIFAYTYYIVHWEMAASLIAATAFSETSLAVVYSVLVETGLAKKKIGKLIMASTFITNMGTALALSILFVKPNIYTLVFVLVSMVVIYFATKFSHLIFENPKLKNKVIEPEIKYIILLLLVFIYFANLGAGQAILPTFIMGLFMSEHFSETASSRNVKIRLRTVAFAFITPIFFIVGGMRISLSAIAASFNIFIMLFILRIILKYIGVNLFAKRYLTRNRPFTTLLLSTGLTFGAIATIFGLNMGYINDTQFSILLGTIVVSSVVPTVIAQKWFMPIDDEDVVDIKLKHK